MEIKSKAICTVFDIHDNNTLVSNNVFCNITLLWNIKFICYTLLYNKIFFILN